MYARIGAKIKRAREEKFLSQAELGARLGVTATAVNYYEKGKRKISIDDIYRLAAALEKPVEFFLPDENEQRGSGGSKRAYKKQVEVYHKMAGIPVLGTIRAGEPLYAEQNKIGYLPFPKLSEKVTFALKVNGDSMVGEGIYEGDLVLIRRQSYIDFNGQIICALVNGEETTLKKFFKKEDGKIVLRAANPAYPDIVINSERDLTILGVFAGVFKFPAR